MKPTVLVFLFSLLLPLAAAGVEISSIYPQAATAGTPVTVIGGPFSRAASIDLGGHAVNARLSGTRQLVFITPELPAGDYSLFVRDGGQASSQTFSLRIELPPPAIQSLVPDNLDECSDAETRQVSLHGEHIQDGAQLLLDGSAIPYQRAGSSALTFTTPSLQAGSYGLQLVNPDGKRSLPHTLWFSSLPEIDSVSAGENFVNSYQIVISGKNFFHSSVLVLNEYSGSFSDLPPRQRIIPVQGGEAFRGSQARSSQSESVRYQDCHTLIYHRYPPSGQAQRLVFRVSNPNGQQTAPYEVSLP